MWQKDQVLKVYYLPGVPEIFQRSFQIQIAHLDPENITLSGEGIFPRICLDLPRNLKGASTLCNISPLDDKMHFSCFSRVLAVCIICLAVLLLCYSSVAKHIKS